ncbi:MAG: ATP-dependent Clp protease proteolytic subunit [Clostridia bacterium]|nr:ATP-dependent Clp protease proteolytic subunit [Clostridia bacterium]
MSTEEKNTAPTPTLNPEDAPRIKCVPIIGQIEGHYLLGDGQKATKYEELIPLFAEAEEDEKIGGLLIVLNTVGGDVEAGLALAELIAGMSKPTVSLVLGGGHSIGVPLALSADRSFIVPSATMTLHPVRINGLVLGAPQSFDYLNRMQERIIRFITAHSKCPADRVRRLMLNTDEIATDLGTVLDGERAVSEGLIDSLGSIREALSHLHEKMQPGAPAG